MVPLENSTKNHKQKWYHFSEEPKFGKIVHLSFGKIKNLTQEIFANLAPSNPLKPPKIKPPIADFLYPT